MQCTVRLLLFMFYNLYQSHCTPTIDSIFCIISYITQFPSATTSIPSSFLFSFLLQLRADMQEGSCDLKVHINGEQTFYLNQRVVCTFSGMLRKIIVEERGRAQMDCIEIKITDFPGGSYGFELTARFCYNNGIISMNPSNACLLHCSATFLEMTEEFSSCNLLSQAEAFVDGIFYWTWHNVLTSLRSCEFFLASANSSTLLQSLISSLLVKISGNSEIPSLTTSPYASPSSWVSTPDTSGFRLSSYPKTPDTIRPCFSREWWFDDLTVLHPIIIEKIIRALGAYGTENNNLVITRFLLHYLKTAVQRPRVATTDVEMGCRAEYGGLADTAVHGVVLMGMTTFSYRGLFWVLRVVSGLGLSNDCRHKLERLIGLMLDQATLDDLLVSGHDDGCVYDVNLVMRLVRVFVSYDKGAPLQRMKKVGRLLDKYLREIAPDQCLKVSKFIGLVESLPDSARDCIDRVYRALDIYLESHPRLSFEDKSRLCRCLNYEKLTLEACKDLAKNPRIPPRATIQALVSQQSKFQPKMNVMDGAICLPSPAPGVSMSSVYHKEAMVYEKCDLASPSQSSNEKEELRLNLQKMQWRVVELEKLCRKMKGQMSKMVKNKDVGSSPSHHTSRGPRLC